MMNFKLQMLLLKVPVLKVLLPVAFVLALYVSCTKTPDSPPVNLAPAGGYLTIAQLRAMYKGTSIHFTTDISLRCTVTMDESSGNIYKEDYVRDYSGTPTSANTSLPYGAIMLKLLKTGGLFQGDSIRLNLNGSWLDMATGGYLQIDSVNVANQVIKLSTGLKAVPLTVALPALQTLNTIYNGLYVYDAQLVYLNSVEFAATTKGVVDTSCSTCYYGIAYTSAGVVNETYNLRDCSSIADTIGVYTSGFANFAASAIGSPAAIVPAKSGSVVAIFSVYKGMQLTLHSFPEIQLNNPYCP
jgi:hypothetical protein